MRLKIEDGVFIAVMLWLGFIIQMVILPALGVTAIAPCIVLPMLIAFTVYCGSLAGIAAAVCLGVVWDSLLSPALGFTTLPLCAIAWVTAILSKRYKTENLYFTPVVSLGANLVMDLFELLVLYLARRSAVINAAVILRGAVSLLMTGALAIPIYMIFYRFYMRSSRRLRDQRVMGTMFWR